HKVIPHNETKDFYIREAINFIERNFQFPITVEEIAKSCNLNRHYFCRLFREQTNSSPQQFLIQYRLSKACALLKNRNLNLSDIAEQIGYSNQFNFSAAFKRQYGISPRQWRKTL
ncbi:helix-turn-helix transcriptional regulator, partial [Streptococcus agalactiae]|nr:helix-turn-helix transcriptional regulator [Streptococcus agalactiae]MCD0151381.1 helix-turn-helix transcriptional regulator [Streptococcus agalactiae]